VEIEESRMKTWMLALAALLFATAAAADSQDAALASALENVSKDQIAAFNREDAAGMLAHAYTKSPSYDTAKAELTTLFAEADAKAEQVGFQYIGHDDEFALARVKVKVTAADPGFQNNVVDTLMIFHVEGGKWKVFDTHWLGAQLVE
jgi:hypothetical protein